MSFYLGYGPVKTYTNCNPYGCVQNLTCVYYPHANKCIRISRHAVLLEYIPFYQTYQLSTSLPQPQPTFSLMHTFSDSTSLPQSVIFNYVCSVKGKKQLLQQPILLLLTLLQMFLLLLPLSQQPHNYTILLVSPILLIINDSQPVILLHQIPFLFPRASSYTQRCKWVGFGSGSHPW